MATNEDTKVTTAQKSDRSGGGSKCTFDLKGDLSKSPHTHEQDVYKLCLACH